MADERFLINIMRVFDKNEINEELLKDDRHAYLVYQYGILGLSFIQSVMTAQEHVRITNQVSDITDNELIGLVAKAL